MSTTTQDVIENVNGDDRYVSRGWSAFASDGGNATIVRGGRVRVIVTWIGGDAFVVTWEYESGDWRAEQVERDAVAMEVAMTVDALAFA